MVRYECSMGHSAVFMYQMMVFLRRAVGICRLCQTRKPNVSPRQWQKQRNHVHRLVAEARRVYQVSWRRLLVFCFIIYLCRRGIRIVSIAIQSTYYDYAVIILARADSRAKDVPKFNLRRGGRLNRWQFQLSSARLNDRSPGKNVVEVMLY